MRKLVLTTLVGTMLVGVCGLTLAHALQGQIPPPQVSFAATSPDVPFELFRGNRIVIPVRINGHETTVLIDSGASATTLDRAFARSIGLPEGRKIAGHGVGGIVEAELIPGVSFQVGRLRLNKMTVAAMDLSAVARSIGRPINVILGREFFNSAVVSIDWAKNRLQLTPAETFMPKPGATRIDLARKGPFNTIPISIAGGATIEALLDVGAGGALSLPPTYWRSRADLVQLRYADGQAGGVGGMHPAREVTVPEVSLAGKTFTSVPANLSEVGNNNDPTQMTNVGIGLLKQFQVDLDLGHNRIYLTPRRDAPPFDRDRAGARFDLAGNRLKVMFVSPQGPAAAAGLNAGDEIVAVDGRPVSGDYYRAPDWTRATAGRQVTLERADGSRVKITLADYY